MTRELIIADGKAEIWDRTRIAEAPLELIQKHLLTPQPIYIPQLPKNTVSLAIDPTQERAHILTELQPAKRTLNLLTEDTEPLMGDQELWDDANNTTDDDRYYAVARVNMPYVYFLWTMALTDGWTEAYLHWTRAFWRPTRMTSSDDRLWPAAFPNVAENAEVCWGDVSAYGQAGFNKIDYLANSFFGGSVCNPDYGWRLPRAYGSFNAWINDENPLSFANWPEWNDEPQHLKDLTAREAELPTMEPAIDMANPVATFAGTRAWFNNIDINHRNRIARALHGPITALITELDSPAETTAAEESEESE